MRDSPEADAVVEVETLDAERRRVQEVVDAPDGRLRRVAHSWLAVVGVAVCLALFSSGLS